MISAHEMGNLGVNFRKGELLDSWPVARARLAEPVTPDPSRARAAGGARPAKPVKDTDAIVERVAHSRVSVVITGETGAGKEVLARRLHGLSPRARQPFVAINCAAICETLFESELFGHQRGAFTGADQAKMGVIEAADGGTLFLDEVGELSPTAQVKLLRVIETRTIQRVGTVTPRTVDVRFISATNRDFEVDVGMGRFRADLLFRLEGIRLNLPPLRERVAEIVPAAHAFIAELAERDGVAPPTLTEAAARALCAHRWTGNFRELRNVIERAILLADGGEIHPVDLQLDAPGWRLGGAPSEARPEGPLSRERIVAALDACAGNQCRAARMLGISRRTLITRLDEYGIPRPQGRRLKIVR